MIDANGLYIGRNSSSKALTQFGVVIMIQETKSKTPNPENPICKRFK